MDKQEKVKLAITSGIAAVILLILVLFLALSGKKNNDPQALEENIAGYAGSSDTAVTEASKEASAKEETSSSEASSSDVAGEGTVLATTDTTGNTGKTVSGNSFYPTGSAVLNNVYATVKYNTSEQLKEMYSYWEAGNTEAVRDLAHLERFEAMSFALTGSKDFYYYGEKNDEGLPQGIGLAVYADDQYYFGNWSQGKRDGEGTWISFYPAYSSNVVTEHMYTGRWQNDLPQGEGQEHYDYASEHMNNADVYVQNAIGSFAGGLYDGEMYIITVNKSGETTEWTGKCNSGTWSQVAGASVDSKGMIPVLSRKDDTDRHIYMSKDLSKDNGVRNIITGGSIKD